MSNTNSPTWTVENKPDLTTHRGYWLRWTLLVNEFLTQPKDAPKGYRFQARVFNTRGTNIALKATWCESLDSAKSLCAVTATRQIL